MKQLLENILRLVAAHLDQGGPADNQRLQQQLAAYAAMPAERRDFVSAVTAYGALQASIGAAGATADLATQMAQLAERLKAIEDRLTTIAETIATLVDLQLEAATTPAKVSDAP